jgi:hypothetical protein
LGWRGYEPFDPDNCRHWSMSAAPQSIVAHLRNRRHNLAGTFSVRSLLEKPQPEPGTGRVGSRLEPTFAAVMGEAARCSCDGATDPRCRPLAMRRPPPVLRWRLLALSEPEPTSLSTDDRRPGVRLGLVNRRRLLACVHSSVSCLYRFRQRLAGFRWRQSHLLDPFGCCNYNPH